MQNLFMRNLRSTEYADCAGRVDNAAMNEIKQLEALGLVLPSPAYLLGAILFGIIGYLAFRRGRKTARAALTWSGLAVMLYPYAIDQTWLLFAVGTALCAWVYFNWT